ncbi:MAG: PAS domain-containing protein [Tissierellia bacterium]|nr:PAS domain-containing protein [Tissierellia bacterium]
MPNNKEYLLKHYKSIVDFISTIIGPNCEVLLREIAADTGTIIYGKNLKISGRHVGESISGYTLDKIMRVDYQNNDFVSNYVGVSEANQKVFRSSTFYIKRDDELIGLLSVNYNLTDIINFKDFISNNLLFGLDNNIKEQTDYFDTSVEDIINATIENVILHWDRTVPINRIDSSDNPIRHLCEMGVFKYKGSVNKVAEILSISTQSIYRYIKEIENSN